jgi:TatD DNase family protein
MYFNLHTHDVAPSNQVIALVNQYPLDFQSGIPVYSIGIHPWKIDTNHLEKELQIISQKITENECWAIGECGLDKRIETPIEIQIEVFRLQLLLAEKHQKPVVIHCVAAFQEVISLKKEWNITVPLIMHGFSKNWQTANQLLQAGFYLSFGKYLMRNPELGEVFRQVPMDRFFLETDTMEETIVSVYEKAAFYKQMNLVDLQTQINHNLNQVFKK